MPACLSVRDSTCICSLGFLRFAPWPRRAKPIVAERTLPFLALHGRLQPVHLRGIGVEVRNQNQVLRTVHPDVGGSRKIFGDHMKTPIWPHSPDLARCEIGDIHVPPLVKIDSVQIVEPGRKERI